MKNNNKNLREWLEIVKPIIDSPEYQKRKKFRHHGDITVYDHCVRVSIYSYLVARRFKMDYKSAAIAGLLHDFYTTPWQECTEKLPFFKMHGFTHAAIALENSRKYFSEYLNPTIENAILRHMFPLNKIPPKTKVGFLITLVDKYVSIEMFREPESIIQTAKAVGGCK